MDIPRLDDDIVVQPTKIHQRRARKFEKYPHRGQKAAKVLDYAEKKVHMIVRKLINAGMTEEQILEVYKAASAKEGNPVPNEKIPVIRRIIDNAIKYTDIKPAPEYKPRYDPYAKRRKK